jgi:cyclic beta-1,2-glucan synthetase
MEQLVSRLEKTLETIEALPKWNGHLYNWYDTKTLDISKPVYISAVDSGNFIGYLITLIEGLKEVDAQNSMIERFQALVDRADFSKLYHQEKHLFPTGFHVDADRFDNSYYDLLASEARQTSYIATALGWIDKKHWPALGRFLGKNYGYRGLYSWTGTMFEYFMPNLIMPAYENSLIYESLYRALLCQMRQVGKRNLWGLSESAYYAFDSAFHYQYKAFGIRAIALKRGVGQELGVSPYSSFLAMIMDPQAGMDNLENFLKIVPLGRYGFYEAVDFSNTEREEPYSIVKSYMAHHVGMSIVAGTNALKEQIMQRRFMRNPSMNAFRSLLEERIVLEKTGEMYIPTDATFV